MNLWRFDGVPATNQEVVLDDVHVHAGLPGRALRHPRRGPAGGTWPRSCWRRGRTRSSPAPPIRFAAARSGRVEIAVFDLLGRRQRTLLDGQVPAGEREVVWDGRDDAGAPLPAGVYLCRVRSDDIVRTNRMVLVR